MARRDAFTSYVANLANGDRTCRHLNAEAIGRFALPFPPLAEQAAIAAFLDRETAKIDGLVAEQRRLIELLKEKRQAVISHAVTKGLNPHAPMKPSGIEWLGDVPEHWEVMRFQRCAYVAEGQVDNLPMLRHVAEPFDAGGFEGAWGFRPLVTAWEMTAWRFSFSSSISRRCSATSPSIFAVSRSRNAAMAACSVERREQRIVSAVLL